MTKALILTDRCAELYPSFIIPLNFLSPYRVRSPCAFDIAHLQCICMLVMPLLTEYTCTYARPSHLHGSCAGVLSTDKVSIIGPHDLVGGQHRSTQVLIKWNDPQLLQLCTQKYNKQSLQHNNRHIQYMSHIVTVNIGIVSQYVAYNNACDT